MTERETSQITAPPTDGPEARWILWVLSEGGASSFPLPSSGEVVIGRSREADVHVDDHSLSRRHALLQMGLSMSIRDLGSVNGTRVRQVVLDPQVPVPISPGEPVEVGTLTLIVQRQKHLTRPRRLWTHAYFEGRLEDLCSDPVASFAIARLKVEGDASTGEIQELVSAALNTGDCVAAYAPGEYELLFANARPSSAAERLAALQEQLETRGLSATAGLASFPADGRTADVLLARAGQKLRPTASTAPRSDAPLVKDPAMVQLYALVPRVAQANINVLILGETGVGKEMLAESIHGQSPRAAKPLVKINCAALAENLLESELFGHEKGAFTGATEAKTGLLEAAQGGTVMLDEVGELPPGVQAKLLRVLEERKVRRVGGVNARPIDVRFIAATNRDLDADVKRGAFRADLFFRLNGFSLTLPPLRDRRSEILPLAHAFLAEACRAEDRPTPRFSDEAARALEHYGWPGNIRELKNVVDRAALLCTGDTIELAHLPVEKMTAQLLAAAPSSQPVPPPPTDPDQAAAEKQRILDALARCAGNQTQASKLLGMPRRTLVTRLSQYGIARPRKKG